MQEASPALELFLAVAFDQYDQDERYIKFPGGAAEKSHPEVQKVYEGALKAQARVRQVMREEFKNTFGFDPKWGEEGGENNGGQETVEHQPSPEADS